MKDGEIEVHLEVNVVETVQKGQARTKTVVVRQAESSSWSPLLQRDFNGANDCGQFPSGSVVKRGQAEDRATKRV
jgi:hypothetical protein